MPDDPYAGLRAETGFDAMVGERVRSLVDARDGVVVKPRRKSPRQVMMLIDGEDGPVAIDAGLVLKIRPPHLARLQALGLRPVGWLGRSVPVEGGGFEPLPQDLHGRDSMVVWRDPDPRYRIAGWSPWHDGLSGRCYPTLVGAMAWIERAIDVQAGRADTFQGV